MSDEITTRFFGGPDAVRQRLAAAIHQKLEALVAQEKETDPEVSFSRMCQWLDSQCLFGKDGMPSSARFLADGALMRQAIFSRASFALGLSLDETLPAPDLTDDDKVWVVEHMRRNKAGLAAAQSPPTSQTPVSREEQVPIYLMLKAVEEIG